MIRVSSNIKWGGDLSSASNPASGESSWINKCYLKQRIKQKYVHSAQSSPAKCSLEFPRFLKEVSFFLFSILALDLILRNTSSCHVISSRSSTFPFSFFFVHSAHFGPTFLFFSAGFLSFYYTYAESSTTIIRLLLCPLLKKQLIDTFFAALPPSPSFVYQIFHFSFSQLQFLFLPGLHSRSDGSMQ